MENSNFHSTSLAGSISHHSSGATIFTPLPAEVPLIVIGFCRPDQGGFL
ncbi:hypothetical protein [Methanothrix soehngenii]